MKPAKTARAAAPAQTRDAAAPAPRHKKRAASARKPRSLARGRDPAAPWTARERAGFIRGLADGLAVPEAAGAVGRTRTSALAERSRDPQFAARWDSVLDCAFEVLETRLLSVAIGGVAEEPAAFASGRPARHHDDTRLARWILSNLRDSRMGDGGKRIHRERTASASQPSSTPRGVAAPDPAVVSPQRLDAAAEQARIDRLIDEVAERIAAAEARLASPQLH